MSVSLSSSLHIIVTGSTVALLYCDLLPTPSNIRQSESEIIITVSVKVTTELTNPIKSVEEVEANNQRNVKDLVNEAFKLNNGLNDDYYKHFKVTSRSDNVVVLLNTELSYFEDDTVLDISYNHDPTDEEKIETMKHYTYPPSDYGSKKENELRNLQLSFRKVPICDHREGRVGDDVTLYYQGFQRFVDDCHNIKLSTENLDFAKKVCGEMSNYFPDEKKRKNAFADAIKKYFEVDVQLEVEESTADIAIGPNFCVIIEVKNESGQEESDSHSQVIGYYVQKLEKRKPAQCPAPAYLIELVGPQLTISGAVFGTYVFVDKLIDPVELVPQHNKEAIFKIARIFKALKDAIRAIRSYDTVLPQIHKPRYPTVTLQIMDDEKAEIDITYTKRIQANMFEGTAPRLGNLIIHFVENYNRNVHDLMHKNGLAPEILKYAIAKDTRYMAIIMERTCEVTSFADYLKTYPDETQKEAIFKECEKALATMHREGLCHGNFTHESILIQQQQQDKKIFVVNFQFSGKFREERHGMVITPEGDDASLQQIKELLEIQ